MRGLWGTAPRSPITFLNLKGIEITASMEKYIAVAEEAGKSWGGSSLS